MTQRRLLACFAHPDDEAFSVSGTLFGLTVQGIVVHLVCATGGEEGEIHTPEAATRETLGRVRYLELCRSCQVLGMEPPIMLGYRDSGWGDSSAQYHPEAFVQASPELVIEQLVAEIRRFRPQVVLTFEPGGLSGHKDHITISRYTTVACAQAGDAMAFVTQVHAGLAPYRPHRLFYVARPRGFRMAWALRLRQGGIDSPLPPPALWDQGVPPEDIHLTLDVRPYLDRKLASILCHQTQIGPDWPLHRTTPDVLADVLGQEYLLRAYPPVQNGATLALELFDGLAAED